MVNHKPPLTQQILANLDDFSLVLGGFLFQFFRRAHLTGGAGQLLRRRVFVIAFLCWIPLLLLSVFSGQAWGNAVRLPFLMDIEIHVRFLLALPLLIIAELVVHQRIRPLVNLFLERGLVPENALGQFNTAIKSAMKLRNSATIEVTLILLVYLVGILFIWRTQIALDISSWYGEEVNGSTRLSPAGWWLTLVSLPLFQFLLVRWYFRLIIWTRFLWQVSKIPLQLIPTNPDRAAGLGFLSQVCYAFSPLALAQGALLAGVLSERIFFSGASFTEFKIEIVGLAIHIFISILGPLLAFTPQLLTAKRKGLIDYGNLAQIYVQEFDQKWIRNYGTVTEPLIGSSDIQSLADLKSGIDIIASTRAFPFNLQHVIQLVVITLLPVAPLLLTTFSLEELLLKVFKVLIP